MQQPASHSSGKIDSVTASEILGDAQGLAPTEKEKKGGRVVATSRDNANKLRPSIGRNRSVRVEYRNHATPGARECFEPQT